MQYRTKYVVNYNHMKNCSLGLILVILYFILCSTLPQYENLLNILSFPPCLDSSFQNETCLAAEKSLLYHRNRVTLNLSISRELKIADIDVGLSSYVSNFQEFILKNRYFNYHLLFTQFHNQEIVGPSKVEWLSHLLNLELIISRYL